MESHLIIAFSGILIILVLCIAAAVMGRSGAKLFDSAGPIPNSSLSLINSLQTSIAANQGWVYLGERKFIDENRAAWKSIDNGLINLQEAVDGNSEIVSEFEIDQVTESITRLRNLQAGIAYVPESSNRSSEEIYSSNIAPVVTEVNSLLDQIETEALLDQHVLLSIEKYFTETALQLELSIKSREYIDSQKYTQARDHLMLSTIPVAHQIVIGESSDNNKLKKLQSALKEFVEKTDQASLSRQVESNNQVRQFLFKHAVPLNNGIIAILHNVVTKAQAQADIRRGIIKQVMSFSLKAATIALVALIISAFILSINNANKLVSRLASLSDAVGGFSENDTYKPIAVQRDDEISNLASLFNVMAMAIKEKQKTLKTYQNELELRVARRTRDLFSAKEFAETTLRSVGDALITVDCDLIISTINPAGERLLSVSADRAVGQPLVSIVDLQSGFEVFDLKSAIAKSTQTRQLLSPEETLHLNFAAKSSIPVKVSLAPIADMKTNKGGSIVVLRNVEREMRLQSELSYQANHDPLTGLRNRASFNAEVEGVLSGNSDNPHTHVIAFLDLDKFKVINDSCGHAAGDELLKQISRLLSLNLRSGDMLARLGGDEFAIMLRECDIKYGEAIALSLRDRVANHRFSWDGRVFSVGVSIGIAECSPGVMALKDILTDADLACYAAKAAGRNKVRVSELGHATIDRNEHKVLRQESLVLKLRERQPELKMKYIGGTIAPNSGPLYGPRLEFLDDKGHAIAEHEVQSAIERTGLQAAYDGCLLSKALLMIAESRHSLESGPLGIRLHLSDALFNDEGLFEQLTNDLEQYPLLQDMLYFSFSEHAVFNNLESARSKLDVLRHYGVRIIMKDFSGSFSSIANIRGISIDYLQIDAAIVNDILLHPIHHIVVRTICELADVSGMQTIVSGHFSEELYDTLIDLGVNVVLREHQKNERSADTAVTPYTPELPFTKAS